METITATTTTSIFFRSNTSGVNGRRLPAGTTVNVNRNRRGELVASIMDAEMYGVRYTAKIAMDSVQAA